MREETIKDLRTGLCETISVRKEKRNQTNRNRHMRPEEIAEWKSRVETYIA